MAGTNLLRKAPLSYTDGVSAPTNSRPNPRTISNLVFSQDESVLNSSQASDITWQWGQFIDHDITLSPDNLDDPFPVPVPRWDPVFDPSGTGQATIHVDRSAFDPETGTDTHNPRRQINAVTAFIDGSQVYGSERNPCLRSSRQRRYGKAQDLTPRTILALQRARTRERRGEQSPDLFLAGDVRVNEQIGLTSMHTLFVREHNRLAEVIADQNPGLEWRRDLRTGPQSRWCSDTSGHVQRILAPTTGSRRNRPVFWLRPKRRPDHRKRVLSGGLPGRPHPALPESPPPRRRWRDQPDNPCTSVLQSLVLRGSWHLRSPTRPSRPTGPRRRLADHQRSPKPSPPRTARAYLRSGGPQHSAGPRSRCGGLQHRAQRLRLASGGELCRHFI